MGVLREEGGLVLVREAAHDGTAWLRLAPVAAQPPKAVLDRLEREYALRELLDPQWAARPVAMARDRGTTALVLEDPGRTLLASSVGRPWEVGALLRVAIGIAVALEGVHTKGLVHGDVRPANVFADNASGRAWLTGFGVARGTRSEPPGDAADVLAGSLAYVAPEQTGRMNRSADLRSDLYACGATLYELMTGAPPFEVEDAIEAIHSHIAKAPQPPHERVEGLPPSLSAIAMKLLSKDPDERYQTARGLEADLRRCLAAWQSRGSISPFPLGAQDTPSLSLAPRNLHGRDRELALLKAAFERIRAGGDAEFVLVTGPPGIGKSALVNELGKWVSSVGGQFALGKFEQYRRDIPYATFAQALGGVARAVLSRSEPEVARWRTSLARSFGAYGYLVANVIPEIELLIGKQDVLPELPPQEAKSRLRAMLRDLLGGVATPEQPLVIFLDDLQWLDFATLDLLEYIVARRPLRQLLILGAARDHGGETSEALRETTARMKELGASVSELPLAALEASAVEGLFAETLACDAAQVAPLSALVHDKTGGNPFFALQLLATMSDGELLRFDAASRAWTWELPRIRQAEFTTDVVDLMVSRLERLTAPARGGLQELACLGNSVPMPLLAALHEGSEERVTAVLSEAIEAGFVLNHAGAFSFSHDRIHEASYTLLHEDERAALHLRLGRALVAATPDSARSALVFDIVNQYNRAATLLRAEEERMQVAELNLMAARRAKAATAYVSALSYVASGSALLPADAWDRCYDLVFGIELARAQCESLSGQHASAEERLSVLALRARSLIDFASVVRAQTDLLTTTDKHVGALEACFVYLRRVGVDWSLQPSDEDVQRGLEAVLRALGDRSIESLVDLPLVTDPECRATMDILGNMVAACFSVSRNLLALVVLRIGELSLVHGNTDASAVGYAVMGMFLGPRFGKETEGLQFGQLGVALLEKRGLKRFQGFAVAGSVANVLTWTRHLRDSATLCRQTFEACVEAGEFVPATYLSKNAVESRLGCGDPLSEVQHDAVGYLVFARDARYALLSEYLSTMLGLIRTLRGLTPTFGRFDDGSFDESAFERSLEARRTTDLVAVLYWIRKLQARYHADEFGDALEASSRARNLVGLMTDGFVRTEFHFYSALANARGRGAGGLDAILEHQRHLLRGSKLSPQNFACRVATVAAEIARLEGRELDAERLYERAIDLAREEGFVQIEAMANEAAARFHADRGFGTIARAYLREARRAYVRWGALGKVAQLDHSFGHLREESLQASPPTTPDDLINALDVAAVVKTSQTLSSEIVLERLLEALLRAALAHAGAQQGALLVSDEGGLRVEAMAKTGPKGIDVDVRPHPVTPSELPEAMIRFVARSLENVIVADASATNPFVDDPYVAKSGCRSAMCLPLVKQSRLIGILYLENNLAPHVFTPARIAVLGMLASQAAISLENARLYLELREENRIRAQAEVELKRSEAYSAEAQALSRTGSFGWNPSTREYFASEETRRLLGLDPKTMPTPEQVTAAIHPDDRATIATLFAGSVSAQQEPVDVEHRALMPDGSVKRIHVVARETRNARGEVEFVGAAMDVTEQRRAQAELEQSAETLNTVRGELAQVARVTSLGVLAASIAHEVNQPLTGILNNVATCQLMLGAAQPNVVGAQGTVERMARDAKRAAEIIARLRKLFSNKDTASEVLDLNEATQEVIALSRSELQRNRVSVRTELSDSLPRVTGDRVQLQQVVLNLLLNGSDAMSALEEGRPRQLLVKTEYEPIQRVRLSVRDEGVGFTPEVANRLFEPFFTSKSNGMGIGLSVSRRIIENHNGALRAVRNDGPGATFEFSIPAVPT
jgi:PAS domain S-box-containing protein